MRSFPIEEALAAGYWQKLASSIGAAYKKGSRVSASQTVALRKRATRVARVLQLRRRRDSLRKGNRSEFKNG
jgi:hypothetical protein